MFRRLKNNLLDRAENFIASHRRADREAEEAERLKAVETKAHQAADWLTAKLGLENHKVLVEPSGGDRPRLVVEVDGYSPVHLGITPQELDKKVPGVQQSWSNGELKNYIIDTPQGFYMLESRWHGDASLGY
jgi:hypothetical protein